MPAGDIPWLAVAVHNCWFCKALTQHDALTQPLPRRDGTYMAGMRCVNCGALSVIEIGASTFPTAQWRLEAEEDLTWLPPSAVFKDYPDVPDPIRQAAGEAHACLSIGAYRAAAIMARAVVEAVANHQKIEAHNLKDKIDTLFEQGLITPRVRRQAHEVRYIGNEMAHGEFVEPVDSAAAEEAVEIMGKILGTVFQDEAQLDRLEAARKARKKQRREQADQDQPTTPAD